MSAALECREVAKSFGGLQAAKGISFTLAEGEVVGVIGANGAGKTTLLNVISGYLAPDMGSVKLHGMEITGWKPRRIKRQGVGRSFQIPQVFGSSTALENVMLAEAGALDRGLSWLLPFSDEQRAAAALELLESFGLQEYSESPTQIMPHGARKLVDIVVALAAKPKLVLLDEPTSGVSADEKDQVMSMLWSTFRREGTTVLFIEHDMDLVERYASRVIALYEGAVIADGAASQVLNESSVIRFIRGAKYAKAARDA